MSINIEKMRVEMRLENRRFLIQTVAAAGGLMGGGAGLLALILHWMGKL